MDLTTILVIALLALVGLVIVAQSVIIGVLVRITGESVQRDTLALWVQQGARWALHEADTLAEHTAPTWDDNLVELIRTVLADALVEDPPEPEPTPEPLPPEPEPEPAPAPTVDFVGPLAFSHSEEREDPDGGNVRKIAVPVGFEYVGDPGNPQGEHAIHPDVHWIDDAFRFSISHRAGAFGYKIPFALGAGEEALVEVGYRAQVTSEIDAPLGEWLWFEGCAVTIYGRQDFIPNRGVTNGLGAARWEITAVHAITHVVVRLRVQDANANDGSYVDWTSITVKKK